jgi:hypothetical protein
MFHRYPVDCWRFYPDSGVALVNWGKKSGLQPALLESYVAYQSNDQWNDFVAVFLKDENFVSRYPVRILDKHQDFYNGLKFGSSNSINLKNVPEDLTKLHAIRSIAAGNLKVR